MLNFDFHSNNLEACFKKVKSSALGLTSAEAEHRLLKHGQNKLSGTKPLGKLAIFLSQFKSPLIYVLLFAGTISLLVEEYSNAQVIFLAVFINSIIGFIQENKANNALNQLKKMVEHKTIVRRDGQEKEINSVEVAVGDVILLRAGQKIPADGRIIKSIDLQVNEASLTGESMPIFKVNQLVDAGTVVADRKNMVYSGTSVVGGSGEVLIIAKGDRTELGKISEMVRTTPETKTPLQARLLSLSKFFAIIAGIVCAFILIEGLVQGREFFSIFLTAIAVAVAAIPEGLVVAVTVILILGMKQILKQKALTRKLVAAETLGSTTVICSDKTGTLTEGKMKVAHLIIGEREFSLADLTDVKVVKGLEDLFLALEIGVLCNNAFVEKGIDELHPDRVLGLPVEVALLSVGLELGLDKQKLLTHLPKVAELPFTSENKFMITLHHSSHDGYLLYEKGAPEILLAKSGSVLINGQEKTLSNEERQKLFAKNDSLTARGLRVVAITYRRISKLPWAVTDEPKDWSSLDKELVFVGFVALKDPLRPDASKTISLCRQAGIRPIIITGDHRLTAQAIAQEVGLDGRLVMTGEELEKVSDEELKKIVKKYDVYARVSPHHKLRIVKALQANGEVVAMTGDGLNDSPALKAADIGVCLGSGTDVAKETSDIVLLDDNFSVIVSAVREGRIIFRNIRKSITYLVSDCFSEMILITGSIFFGTPLALLPGQILWVNIVNDGFPNFSLAFEHSEEGVMDEPPLKKNTPIVNREMKMIIVGLGLVRDIGLSLLFVYLFKRADVYGLNIDYLRTLFFAILGFKSITSIFSLRSFNTSILKINHLRNPYLLGAFAISFTLLILGIYWGPMQGFLQTVDLRWPSWILILSVASINIFMIELIKYFFIIKPHAEK